jgi:hypothetical protein
MWAGWELVMKHLNGRNCCQAIFYTPLIIRSHIPPNQTWVIYCQGPCGLNQGFLLMACRLFASHWCLLCDWLTFFNVLSLCIMKHSYSLNWVFYFMWIISTNSAWRNLLKKIVEWYKESTLNSKLMAFFNKVPWSFNKLRFIYNLVACKLI